MSAPLPATKLSEVVNICGIPGLKNTNPFSNFGKNKAKLRNDLTALINKDPVAAHTGLGILFNYESEFEQALKEFKKAFEISRGSYSQLRNYINALILVGEIDNSIDLLFKSLEKYPNDMSIFEAILNLISDYCLTEKIDYLLEISKSFNNISLDYKNVIKRTYEIEYFLSSNQISMDVYRKLKHHFISVQNIFFTVSTIHRDSFYLNNEFKTLTSIKKIPKCYLGDRDVVGDMNDYFQDLIINTYEEFSINSLSNEDKLSFYFSIYEGE